MKGAQVTVTAIEDDLQYMLNSATSEETGLSCVYFASCTDIGVSYQHK